MKRSVGIGLGTLALAVFILPATFSFTAKSSINSLYESLKFIDKEPVMHNWMSIEQAQDSAKQRPKKFFVEIYTDWCSVCKMLDKKTLSKPRITEMLDKYYYSVKLNAEKMDPVLFNDSLYGYDSTKGRNGIHSLALHLGKEAGTVSYPTMVILDENLNVIYRYPSFINVINLEEVLDMYR